LKKQTILPTLAKRSDAMAAYMQDGILKDAHASWMVCMCGILRQAVSTARTIQTVRISECGFCAAVMLQTNFAALSAEKPLKFRDCCRTTNARTSSVLTVEKEISTHMKSREVLTMRLIDADALLNDLKESAKAAREWGEETQDEEIKIRAEQAYVTFVECALRVKNAPTIDAEPVRHGKLLEGKTFNDQHCSVCGQMFRDDISFILPYDENGSPMPKRCPECGCYWDGGAENGNR
jgi:hypothetical protein